jgi:hypothetical protein
LEIIPITSPLITYVSRSVIANEGNITAGGTALSNIDVIIQVQNSQKQIISEQTVPTDSSGNWNAIINKALAVGDYYLLATARDKNMASSLPVVSDVVKVKTKPMLVIGTLEITQLWFFIILILILLISFGSGFFTFYKWRGQLDRRVFIAQRDVVNIFETLKKDIDKLLKNHVDGKFSESDLTEMEYTLKDMRDNLEKSRRYVVDNIREIDK